MRTCNSKVILLVIVFVIVVGGCSKDTPDMSGRYVSEDGNSRKEINIVPIKEGAYSIYAEALLGVESVGGPESYSGVYRGVIEDTILSCTGSKSEMFEFELYRTNDGIEIRGPGNRSAISDMCEYSGFYEYRGSSVVSFPESGSYIDSVETKVIYYDDDWEEVGRNKAEYYRIISYKNGKPEGVVRDYYISGNIQWSGGLISENPDVFNGDCTYYYENGKPSATAQYVNGEIDGTEISYYESGKKERELYFKNGMATQISKAYYPSGKIKWTIEDGYIGTVGEQKYVNGKYTYYDESGEKTRVVRSVNGEIEEVLWENKLPIEDWMIGDWYYENPVLPNVRNVYSISSRGFSSKQVRTNGHVLDSRYYYYIVCGTKKDWIKIAHMDEPMDGRGYMCSVPSSIIEIHRVDRNHMEFNRIPMTRY